MLCARSSLVWITLSAVSLLPAGCRQDQSFGPTIRTSAAADIAGDTRDANRAPEIPLFGDRPLVEPLPAEGRSITNLTRHSFTTDGLDFDPDVCADQDLLVFASTRNSERPDIYVKSIGGTALTQLTSDPADDVQPRLSPGAERVVFASNRAGNWDIWMVNRDGTGLVQLTSELTDEIAPCWSPDAREVAYTVWGPRSRQWEIWTLSVTQPGTRRFLAYGMFPSWSPDGNRLVYQRPKQRGSRMHSVWTLELVDGEARHPTQIAQRDDAACIAPRWSPDGMSVVYCTVPETFGAGGTERASGIADLWVVDPGTGATVKLTDGADACFNPVWAGDGRIYFVSPRAGTENVWSLLHADRPIRTVRTHGDKTSRSASASGAH